MSPHRLAFVVAALAASLSAPPACATPPCQPLACATTTCSTTACPTTACATTACATTTCATTTCATAHEAGEVTAVFGEAQALGRIESPDLDELSGMEPSASEDDLYWAHDDDFPRLFAMTEAGQHIAKIEVTDTTNTDWEEMVAYQVDGRSFLLIADIGGNRLPRPDYDLICLAEPRRDPQTGLYPTEIAPEWTVHFNYPDHEENVNCEALAIDVETAQILLLTKGKSGHDAAQLYSLPLPSASATGLMATSLGVIDSITDFVVERSGIEARPTAMDISDDGSLAVVLTYHHAFAFAHAAGEPWFDTFSRTPTLVTLPFMPQAEALCFDRHGDALIVTSERRGQRQHAPVYRVPVARPARG